MTEYRLRSASTMGGLVAVMVLFSGSIALAARAALLGEPEGTTLGVSLSGVLAYLAWSSVKNWSKNPIYKIDEDCFVVSSGGVSRTYCRADVLSIQITKIGGGEQADGAIRVNMRDGQIIWFHGVGTARDFADELIRWKAAGGRTESG